MSPDPEVVEHRVTVVVITWNRVREVLRTLDRLLALPERPPIVVVDNGSVDGTASAVRRRHPSVEVIALPRNLGGAGRTAGVRRATTPYVAFCDDDTWWEPGALRRAADHLDDHPRLAVLTGRILVEPGGREDPICPELEASPLPRPPDAPGYPLLSFLAGASVVRRRAYLGSGGFDPVVFIGGEEELLGADLAAAGWAMAYVPDVVLHHQASELRDSHVRRRLGIRNTLWFTWLRRPLPKALLHTVDLSRRLPPDRHTVRALADAAGGSGWVVRNRRALPAEIDSGLRLLEIQQRSSQARRYVS